MRFNFVRTTLCLHRSKKFKDPVDTENHVIYWDEAAVSARDRTTWWIREAIRISKQVSKTIL